MNSRTIFCVLLSVVILCSTEVSSCSRRRRRSPPPPPPTKYRPDFVGCPSDIRVNADIAVLTKVVTWNTPTAKSRNVASRTVIVTQTAGPKSGKRFQGGIPEKITYRADEGNGVPPAYCNFYVTVTVLTCNPLTSLQHGTRSCSGARGYIYGSVCTSTCDTGYTLTGPARISCEASQTWDNQAPTCQPVDCGTPAPIANGQAVCYRGHTYPEICSIQCNNAYTVAGPPFMSCQSDGAWTAAAACGDKQLPTFPNGCPANKVLFSGALESPVAVFWTDPDVNDNSGQPVTLTSNPARGTLLGPGYYIFTITATDLSSNAATCTFVVEVKSRECNALSAPLYSQVTCSRGYIEGSECKVTCYQGYDLQGQEILTCMNSENWNAPLPTCARGSCKPPPQVDNGALVCASGHTYLSVCDLQCNSGFEVQSPPYVQCNVDGTWTTSGSCQDTEAPDFPQGCPQNIEVYSASLGQPNLVTWSPPQVTDNSGQQVNLVSSIDPGSNFSIGVTRVTYTASDIIGNSATCSFTVTVNSAVCPVPDLEPFNRTQTRMTYDCPDGYVYGASCKLNCTYGYPLVGPDTITCQRNDATFPPTMFWEWNGPNAVKPECSESNCPDLKPPMNGAVACNQATFGWDCMMSCMEPYDVPAVMPLDGHIYCTNSNPVWTPSSIPDCTEIVRPGGVRLHSDLFYFSGSCNTSLDELKQNFIDRMNSNPILANSCANVPSCTVSNIKVMCGPMSGRRKREAEERTRRSATSHYVRIDFEIVIPIDTLTSHSGEQLKQLIDSTKTSIYDSLQAFDANGTFAEPGMTSGGFGNPTPKADCPAGTRSSITSFLNCVGCSKGHYMTMTNGQTQCVECEVGSYMELDIATACTTCPPGMSTLSTGSQAAQDCLELCTAGTYSPNGFVPCQPCPPGHYQSRDGAKTCDLCPTNLWTDNAGAKSISDCAPADLMLTNFSVTGKMTSQWSVLTVAAWVRLTNSSSVSIGVSDSAGMLANTQIVSDGATVKMSGQTSDQSDSYGPTTLGDTFWKKAVFILASPSVTLTPSLYPAGVSLLTLSRIPFSETSLTVSTGVNRVAISGLTAVARFPTQEEGTGAASSCMGNNSSENILLWSPKPSDIIFPSVCDAVDDCLSQPCGPNGVCQDRYKGVFCQCQNGWSGVDCSTPPDNCYQNQCQNGATCVNGNAAYTCTCPPGFVGNTCGDVVVDGGWGEWKPWSTCSATCGGTQERVRPCNNPTPEFGGQNCTGLSTESRKCGELVCVVEGSWSAWTTWSACSATCGGAQRTRDRTCQKPAGTSPNEVAVCEGDVHSEVQSCNSSSVPCPVHGGWSTWNKWTPCSVSCGAGTKSRDRSCDSPVPANGGNNCSGLATESANCNEGQCPSCRPTTLPRSTGGMWVCSETQAPYLRNCTLTCFPGYVIAETPTPFTCGEETSYLWNHQRNPNPGGQELLPVCIRPTAMSSMTYTQTVRMNAACGDSAAVVSGVSQNLDNNIVCLRTGLCSLQVTPSCPAAGNGRRRRSLSDLQLSMHFVLTIPQNATFTSTGNASAEWENYQQVLAIAQQSLDQANQTGTFLTVTVNGQTITPDLNTVTDALDVTCPPGSVLLSGYCVSCPAGSKQEGEQCVLCPYGQWQSQPGSVHCHTCPNDLTWDLMGATDVSQCLYPLNSKTEHDDDDKDDDDDNLALAIALPIVCVIAIIGVVVAVIYKFKYKSAQASATSRTPLGSWASLRKVAPSPTPNGWLDPPPEYNPAGSSLPPAYAALESTPVFEMKAPLNPTRLPPIDHSVFKPPHHLPPIVHATPKTTE